MICYLGTKVGLRTITRQSARMGERPLTNMSFEKEISELNEYYFFREFTFSKNTFRPTPRQEAELADNIVWLDDLLIVYQLKERAAPEKTSPSTEERWFDRKVLKQATRQIRDTLAFLCEHEQIQLENHRGHTFRLSVSSIAAIHKVVCYLAHKDLPKTSRNRKFHRSRTAGVIHLIPVDDYLGLLRTLLTPPEVAEYLAFREKLIDKWEREIAELPEQALVGQYLNGYIDTRPSIEFVEYLAALDHRAEEWDMSGMIKQFPGRVYTHNEPTDYYRIVTEIAKLNRNELGEFKKRVQLSIDKARANTFVQPYRMAIPRTNCGFVFIPLVDELFEHKRQALLNLTYACKYDLKLPKCIGVSFAPEQEGWYSVEWCYMESPWERDAELDKKLRQDSPFRAVNTARLGRYSFREEE